jgi:uncharacterized protein
MSQLRQRLSRELQSIPLFDTHEHFVEEASTLGGKPDIFSFLHYVDCDMTSASHQELSSDLSSSGMSFDEKKETFFALWPYVRHTGYGQALSLMATELFGVERIAVETFDELNENASTFRKPGYYQTMLRERANIARSARTVWSGTPTCCDQDFLFPVPQFDSFATPSNRADLHELEQQTGVSIHSLNDLLTALDVAFDKRVDEHMIGVKIFLAYKRTLHFENVTYAGAEQVFNRLATVHRDTPVGFAEAKPLQDFMIHQIVQQAVERGLPIQIHTGFQNDNANYVSNTDPTHLTDLFMTYPGGRFSLLHGGWPYTRQWVSLAKVFPNVYADMAWTYIVGPRMATGLLHELLDSVPLNKIQAFGGDYDFAEGAYAHARLARRAIRRMLAERIEADDMTEDEALFVAGNIMHDNAARMYGFPTLDQ